MVTDKQREQITEAFDILCEVYKQMQEQKNTKRAVKILDTVMPRLEDIIWMRQGGKR